MKIYTVGHSNHSFEHFLGLLTKHGINCVVDVRSIAASRFNPQFNKQRLSESLKQHEIRYLHFDKEFGARRVDKMLLGNDGRLDFKKVSASSEFKEGVLRLKSGMVKGFVIALMCAEANPLECHRFGMVCRFLPKKEFDIFHILKDGSLLSQHALEHQLLRSLEKKILKINSEAADQLSLAYDLLNLKIGYKP